MYHNKYKVFFFKFFTQSRNTDTFWIKIQIQIEISTKMYTPFLIGLN